MQDFKFECGKFLISQPKSLSQKVFIRLAPKFVVLIFNASILSILTIREILFKKKGKIYAQPLSQTHYPKKQPATFAMAYF
jgi:hypothetical protein